MLRLNPASVDDLLKAHKLMMNGLVPENGKFRSGGVDVFDGEVLIHMDSVNGFKKDAPVKYCAKFTLSCPFPNTLAALNSASF